MIEIYFSDVLLIHPKDENVISKMPMFYGVQSTISTFEISLVIITEDVGKIVNILLVNGLEVAFQVVTIKAPGLQKMETA